MSLANVCCVCVVVGTNDLDNGVKRNAWLWMIVRDICEGLQSIETEIREQCRNCLTFGWLRILPRLDRDGLDRDCMERVRSAVNAEVTLR